MKNSVAMCLTAVAVLTPGWGYEAKTLDTQDAANGGEMGTGSDTGTFFIGGMRQPG